MKIKSIIVHGLFGKSAVMSYNFHDDLNILTGRNGSGKTTIMKLVWLIISGNVVTALREVSFSRCTLVTSEYTCTVTRTGPIQCKIELEIDGERQLFEDDDIEDPEYEPFSESDSAEEKANPHIIAKGSSIFFPTFRRIEGGFSLVAGRSPRSRTLVKPTSEIDDALSALSRRLTNGEHTFVAAISTQDIVSLLLRRYASFSEEINAHQEDVSRNVINKIKHFERTQSNRQDAEALLSETRAEIEKIEDFRAYIMQPLSAVRSLAERLFQHAGIQFDKRLSFGDAAEAINSEQLSAGEKQMLSFICYNSFHNNSVIFIDEPELSLHVDWQRQLYPILESQKSGNQFIFATHSPFIYGKYPDKEVTIGDDRGE